jgi:uncharacterized protein
MVSATTPDHEDILKFTKEPASANTVLRVERGSILIGNQTYTGNIGLLAHTVIDTWPDFPVSELTEELLSPVLDQSPELLILGTGWQNVFAPRELTFALARRGIGLDVMDTPAACRTFNVLVSEDRLPGAILYIQDQTT